MNIINAITKPKGFRMVVYGTHGIGKTTLASKLPNTLFLDFEDGTHGIEVAKVDRSDLPVSFASLNATFAELTRDKHGFRNLVIDSVDKLEEILDKSTSEGKSYGSVFAVNDYGRTVSDFTSNFGRMLDNASTMVESGMNIMFIAHEQTRKCEPLEGSGAYDHHELKLSKGNTKLLMQWADIVIFTAYKTFAVKDSDTKKVRAGGGKRWCFTVHTNDWEAKHRASINLPDDCSLDEMTKILPKALEEATITKEEEKEKELRIERWKRAAELAAENGALEKAEEVFAKRKREQELASKNKEIKTDTSKPSESEAVTLFKKLLSQYAVTEEKMREYAATKLNDRYGIDFKTTDLNKWPEEALNWLNRGFDKIVTKLK